MLEAASGTTWGRPALGLGIRHVPCARSKSSHRARSTSEHRAPVSSRSMNAVLIGGLAYLLIAPTRAWNSPSLRMRALGVPSGLDLTLAAGFDSINPSRHASCRQARTEARKRFPAVLWSFAIERKTRSTASAVISSRRCLLYTSDAADEE